MDASVAVKWTVAETGRDQALRVLDRADELVAPDLLVAEAANVLRRKCRLGEISMQQSEEALRAIRTTIPRFVPSLELADDAMALAHQLDHSAYDCFYLACALPAAILVTADDRFAAKCRANGFSSFVCSPSDVDKGAPVPSVGIEHSKLETIERLSAQLEKTFESLRDSASFPESGLRIFIPSEIYRPAFDSPPYRRLLFELDKLTDEELATLVALGWLGRSYQNTEEWHSLVTNASFLVAEGRDKHKRYFVAQMSKVASGLAKLHASQAPLAAR
ncbi:MAG: PIN domain-containing protein [Xanthobacteraceae bacterium]